MTYLTVKNALWLSIGWMSCAAQAQDAWVVGQSVPLTGGNAAFGKDIRDGAWAYFKSVNAKGGVAGRPIELQTLDDKNDRKTAAENTQKLLENKSLVALFGYASATLSLDAMPLAEKAGVLFFAPFTGANPVRVANPVVYTMRASYGEELAKMLSFWTSMGMKQVVVVHYADEVGKQNLDLVTDYLGKINLKPQAFALSRTESVSPTLMDALYALKPEVIINTTLSGHAAEISKQMLARQRMVPMSSLSFVGTHQYIDAAGPSSAGVSIAQVVPNPSSGLPVVRECAKALADAKVTQQAMNSTHLEACIGAKVLTEALRRTRKPGDATGVLASLQNLGTYDTGGFTVNFGPGNHHGSKFVDLAVVSRDGKLRN